MGENKQPPTTPVVGGSMELPPISASGCTIVTLSCKDDFLTQYRDQSDRCVLIYTDVTCVMFLLCIVQQIALN